jgi:site-specific recombinase XerC
MPCHHALAEALHAYIDAAGIAEDRKGWLFRTARGHNGTALSNNPMSQPDAWRMIRRRAAAAGIAAEIGCHAFRATGITAYLSNGGAFEHAQEMAAHESPRTTKLYDRTKERLTQDEVERISCDAIPSANGSGLCNWPDPDATPTSAMNARPRTSPQRSNAPNTFNSVQSGFSPRRPG